MYYKKFSQAVIDSIGFYVYALQDPRDNRVFYVGKGMGNRWYSHLEDATDKKWDVDKNAVSEKIGLIREIHAENLHVIVSIIRHGISTEFNAFEIEASLIHSFKLLERSTGEKFFELTNLVEGHHPERGLMSTKILQSLYEAEPVSGINEPCVLIRIPRLWYPEILPAELMAVTSMWWSCSPNKHNAKYALAISGGVIRAAYRIARWRERREPDNDWQHDVGKKPRWGFPDGCEEATEMSHYLNHSVQHLFKKGSANPIMWLNC
jgi:hypothetical protein